MIRYFTGKFNSRTLPEILLVGGIYFGLARISLLLSFGNTNVSPVWPPAGFALAMMILYGYRIIPGILFGAFVVNLVVFITNNASDFATEFWTSLFICIGNTIEAATGAYVFRKFVPHARKDGFFAETRSIFWFLYTAIVMCLVGSVIGATTLYFSKIIAPEDYLLISFTWWAGDLAGVLLFTPLIVTWWKKPLRTLFTTGDKPQSYAESVFIFLSVLLISGVVFDEWFSAEPIFRWAFWVIPVLVWAAVRLEQHISITAVCLASLMALFGTLRGNGPFGDLIFNEALISVEGFTAVMVMTTLLLNSTVKGLKNAESKLRAAHNDLEKRIAERTASLRQQKEFVETLFNSVEDPIIVLDRDGNYLAVNRKTEQIYNRERKDFIGKNAFELYPSLKEASTYTNFLRAFKGEVIHDMAYFSSITEKYFENFYFPLKDNQNNVYGVLILGHDITEIKESEKLVKESEEKFIKLFHSSPFGITLTEMGSGRFLEVNDNFLEMMGVTREEIAGRTSLEFEMIDADERNKILLEIQRKGSVNNLEIEVRKKSGEKIWVMQSTEIITVGGEQFFLNAFNEISHRKRAEAQLRESEERIQSIFRSAPDAVIVIDAAGKIVGWNPQAEIIFGWRGKEIIGSILQDTIIPERLRSSHHNALLQFLESGGGGTGMSHIIEMPVVRKDGSEFFASMSISVTLIKGRKHFTAFLSDVSEFRKAQEALKQKSIELQRSNLELEHFAYAASHDLQEPLRSVIAYLQIIEKRYKDKLDADGIEFIHRTVDSSVRMRTLINDLLSYSRVRTMDIEFGKVDSRHLVDVALDNLHTLIEENKGTVTVETPMPVITGSDLQLTLLFQNLISNGIKYKNERPPHVYIAADETDSAWKFSVRDNGMGISPEDFERIFRIFQRLHTRAEFPGTGIGLALCKKVVERHGGTIWVESEPGKGSTFYFTIPKKPEAVMA